MVEVKAASTVRGIERTKIVVGKMMDENIMTVELLDTGQWYGMIVIVMLRGKEAMVGPVQSREACDRRRWVVLSHALRTFDGRDIPLFLRPSTPI